MHARSLPRRVCGLGLGLAALAAAPAQASDPREPAAFHRLYRADALPVLSTEVPVAVEVLAAPGTAWPEAVRRELGERIRAEWGAGNAYGPLRAAVGISVSYPLVTTRLHDRVVIPVVESLEIPVRGALALAASQEPRRVAVLIDVSSSANAPTLFRGEGGGRVDRVTVLEAERRALERLLGALDATRVDVGVIAFGEQTHPIVPFGTPVAEARALLEAFFRAHPEGEGRTDTVCALWTARDWLADTPRGVAREVVLLTDGDLPHSGRFLDCGIASRRGGRDAAARCELERNRTPCPATSGPYPSDGSSDLVQLLAFAGRARRELDVHALVFEADRAAKAYRSLAETTGGQLARVPSAEAIEAALPALVAREIRGVFAANARTGETSANLYDAATRAFDGAVRLEPGPNDVELRIEGARGLVAHYRWRIYAVPGHLERYLAELLERNRALALRADEQRDELRAAAAEGRRPERHLDVVPAPAAPAE